MFQPPANSDNPNDENPDDLSGDLIPNEGHPAGDRVADDPIDQADFDQTDFDEADFDEAEFSLDQLSAAYARVIKGETSETTGARVGGEDPTSTLSETSEPGTADDESPHETEPARQTIDDNAACPISPESIVEAILFVGVPQGVKLTTRSIAAVLRDVSPKEVTKIVKHLNSRYASENGAYRINTVDGGLKYELIESLAKFQQEFFGRNRSVKLSQTAIDVLAIVAYSQPVARETIDKLRSRPSGSVLNQLVRRELLTQLPQEKKSDPQEFVTTDKFLDFFNLTSLGDLPQSHAAAGFDELAD